MLRPRPTPWIELLLGVPGPEEPGEQPVPVGGGDADAGVADGRARPGAPSTRERDLHPAAAGRVLDRVGDAGCRRPARSAAPSTSIGQRRRGRPVAASTPAPSPPGRRPRAATGRTIAPRSAAVRTTCIGPSSTWAVCSRSATSRPQPVAVAGDDLEVGRLLGRQVVALEQQVDVPHDRGQRRAQLVGDRRHELVLDPQRPHEVGDVLVGQRGAGEAAVLSPRTRAGRHRQCPPRQRVVAHPDPAVVELLALGGAVRRHLLASQRGRAVGA